MLEPPLIIFIMKNNKSTFFKAFKYLLLAIPLLFVAPIVVTIGFKALNRNGTYLFLILGIILILLAMIITAVGVIKVTNYFFDREK